MLVVLPAITILNHQRKSSSLDFSLYNVCISFGHYWSPHFYPYLTWL